MIDVPLPRLLNSSTMNEVRRIKPVSASVNLSITPLSTATLVVDIDDDIPLRSYVEMFTTEGSAGIFRVRDIQMQFGGQNLKTIRLEHALCELGDIESVSTSSAEYDSSVGYLMGQIFDYIGQVPNYNQHWTLGTIAPSGTAASYSMAESAGTFLEDIMEIMEQLPDYMLTFDQSSLPWKLNIAQRPTTVSAEGRLSRNVRSASVEMDDRDFIDRIVVTVTDNDGNTTVYQMNDDALIAQYGRVNRVESMEYGTTVATINRFMTRTLNKFKKFKTSVTIDATDLAQITGEPLDSFEIGKKYRLVIDGHNIVTEENITELSWGDIYGDPLSVQVTLAAPPEKVMHFIHKNTTDKVSKKKKV